MPLTHLDPNAALVVVDLQKGIVGLPTVDPIAGILQNAAALARGFRERQLPVVLVNVAGRAPGRTDAGPFKFTFPPDWTDLAPELDRQPTDHLITKHRVGAFLGTDLDAYLRSRNVTQIVLAGVSTSSGVEATARSAYDLGYHVVFATDAMTDMSRDMHDHSVEKAFPKIGERDLTAAVLAQLTSR
jgi:nicotinamidase-related amidase